jgi:ABC-2 type transport system permease protein
MRHARTILWAQWRTLINFSSRGGNTAALVFSVVTYVTWYGLSLFAALLLAKALTMAPGAAGLADPAARTLLFMFGYWQIVPLMVASTGAGLDLRRLVVYPVTHSELFRLEVLLRVSTAVEMVILLCGGIAGILLNPAIPKRSLLPIVPWVLFNLLLAAGLRNLLGRLMARRGYRELMIFAIVVLMALPQLMIVAGVPPGVDRFVRGLATHWWPWQVTARLLFDAFHWIDALAMAAWTAASYLFGRNQFERGFRFDAEEARATAAGEAPPFADRLYRLPGLLLPDPMGAIVEKELRFLSRAPRFRLVFFMGFSFGLLIWLPLALRGSAEGFFASNYLTFVTVYALMLLGEVSFWNTFGFDRSATQIYFLVPVSFERVLLAKNIAAGIFVFLEISAAALVCALLRMPLAASRVAECFAVALVLTLFLLAIGNLGSTYYPRPVDPTHSWRSASGGKFQALLMILYPVLALPIVLAYMARFAFDSTWAFYGVLAVGGALGLLFYWVAMESAASAAHDRKEQIIATLSRGDGPLTA